MKIMRRRLEGALLTADEAARTIRTEGDWELWDGVAVLCDPAGGPSGPLGTELGYWLRRALGTRRIGWVGDASTGYLLKRDPDRLLAPDVSYVSRERLSTWPEKGFVECVPELVAEIRSPSDSWAYVIERGGIWIAHGVSVVWLVDPKRRRVLTLRPTEDPIEACAGGSFSAAPVLPQLEIAVDDLFAVLD
jgi:Uma2 family endonuclease